MTFTLDGDTCRGLLRNPNATNDMVERLLLKKPNKWMLEAIAGSSVANENQLERVYKMSKSYEVLDSLARNSRTPIHILDKLFSKEMYRSSVLTNESLPRDLILSFLASKKGRTKDERTNYRDCCNRLAENSALSEKNDQLKLSKKMISTIDSENSSAPDLLFRNKNLHGEVFEYLLDSEITENAYMFTESQYFSKRHAKLMLFSKDELILAAGISSDYCSEDIVMHARKSASDILRTAGFKNNRFSVDFSNIDYKDHAICLGLLQRDDVPNEALEKISEHEPSTSKHKFYSAWASPKDIPLSVVKRLFHQDLMTPLNSNITSDLLQHFMFHGQSWEKYHACTHPKINRNQIEGYLGLGRNSENESKSIPFYALPDWYEKLVKVINDCDLEKSEWKKSSVPRIFVPNLSSSIGEKDEVIGVIGGYFFKSDSGDARIQNGSSQPVLQIDLKALSKKTGINFGNEILQVWSDENDWGQGVAVVCETISHNCVTVASNKSCFEINEPDRLKKADDYAKATSCFNWSESYYSEKLGLTAPFFITGLNDAGPNVRLINVEQHKILSKKLSKAKINKDLLEEYCSFANERQINEIDAMRYVQQFDLDTSFGNYNEENFMEFLMDSEDYEDEYEDEYDEYEDEFDLELLDEDFEDIGNRRGGWTPLITICGPLNDPIEDYFTVFFCEEDGEGFSYKAMAHRWCY